MGSSIMKTPIMRPPLEAVLFGFERIGMVIRIAWLPILLVMLLYAGAFMLLAGAGVSTVDISTSDPEEAFEALIGTGGFVAGYLGFSMIMPFVVMLLLACVYVAVMRAATHTDFEPPSLPFYFALGARELRYFVTQLLYGIIIGVSAAVMVGFVVGVIGLTAVATEAVAGQAKALIVAPGAALAIWLVLVWLWVVLRLLPVLPIAAVENRISFGDAWAMTRGNFWRLLISGALFVSVLNGVVWILLIIFFIPAGLVVGLLAVVGFGLVGPGAFVLFALLALFFIPALIALASFSLAAEAAFPARLYAYLTGCGEECRIY